MVLGPVASILLAVGGAGAGAAAGKLLAPKQDNASTPIPLPQPPSAADAQAKGDQMAQRRRAANTQTVYTSPLGVGGQADVARKTLTGQ